MNEHSGLTTSVWMKTAQVPAMGSLQENTDADVCIVGAGISGLSTAYLLLKAGKSVVVLDDGPVAAGETERTTAHLSNALDDRYTFLEQKHGAEGSRVAAESHTAAIHRIESIVREEGIDCDFVRLDGYLFVPPGGDETQLQEELQAAHRAGLSDVQLVTRAPLKSFGTGPCLKFPNQAQFHPLKYLDGLLQAIQRMGGRVFSNTHVNSVNSGEQPSVETEQKLKVTCRAVVVATNTPVNDMVAIHTKQAPYRSYVVGLVIPAGAVPLALYWDTAQDAEEEKVGHSAAYHYVRLQSSPSPGTELLIVGGEDHKTGQADNPVERWNRLEAWARERFPECQQVAYRWSGQVMEPVDGIAFIGRNPGDENVYIATGDSGHGMTHGAIAGMLITDLIMGRENPWAKLYEPSRSVAHSAGEYAKENLNVVARYREFLTKGDIPSLHALATDSGAVIRRGASKVAVYRDDTGCFHEFSAVCPHMKCIVHWNSAEKSWDCPCHGSRFTKYGEVLNGPAITGLEKLAEKAAAA